MPTGIYKRKLGMKWTEERKRKFSKLKMGHTTSQETREKISKTKRGSKSYSWVDGRCQNPKWLSWIKNKRNRTKRFLNNNGDFHTFGEWENLKVQYNMTCPCCKRSEPEIKLTEDHIIPLSKGGSDNIENIQPLCKSCNSKKHAKIIKYEKITI